MFRLTATYADGTSADEVWTAHDVLIRMPFLLSSPAVLTLSIERL